MGVGGLEGDLTRPGPPGFQASRRELLIGSGFSAEGEPHFLRPLYPMAGDTGGDDWTGGK